MAAPEERVLSDGEGGALGSARLSPPPVSESPEALAPLEPPPQSNTLIGLPIVAIENILSFLSYDETSQLRLVGAGEEKGEQGSERGALLRPGPGPAGGSSPRRPGAAGPGLEQRGEGGGEASAVPSPGERRGGMGWSGVGWDGMGLSPISPTALEPRVPACRCVPPYTHS